MDVSPLTDDSSLLLRPQNENKSKLNCIPIGLTQGQFSLNAFKIQEEFKWFQMRSVCLMAFCYTYLQDPLKWSSATINTIVIYGAKLVKDNFVNAKDCKDCVVINCTVNVENYVAKIKIEEPSTLDIISSLQSSLQKFFGVHQYGLFRCTNLCYLIWKTNGIYFLFDAQGRESHSPLDDKSGFASLVCTELLKDVCKLIKSLSSLKSDECYTISGIQMKHFRKGLSECAKPRIQYTGTDTYQVVNDRFAILCGKIHIGHPGFQLIKNLQAIAVALMALIYREVQPSNSWNSEMVDKIILLGTKLFHECKKTPQGEVTVKQLPREYCILDYKCNIDYKPYDHSGQLSYSVDEMKKNLLLYLNRAFQGSAQSFSVLIQINSLIFPVWQNNGYFYLFDPYARNENGELFDDKLGKPCVHMHSNLESLCSVLCANLHTIASNDRFVLHGINLSLECKCGGRVSSNDLELLSSFMDDLFWSEMNNFQEMTARSEEICNLNESSDDDIFMETIEGKSRESQSVGSSQSRSTNSSVSISESSASSSQVDSTSQSNEDSTQTLDEPKSPKKKKKDEDSARSRKEKNEANEGEKSGDDHTDKDANEQSGKKKAKKGRKKRKDGKEKRKEGKEKRKGEKSDDDQTDEDANDQSGTKKTKKGRNKRKESTENSKEKEKENSREKGKDEKWKHKNDEENANKAQKKSLVVVQSSSGTETSITKLLNTSFKISDRVLLVTDWGDFFVAHDNDSYILYDGCLCDYNALIQINLNELDSSKSESTIESVVEKIIILNECKSVTKVLEPDRQSGGINTYFWELIEGMVDLMKTTAKYDKIKNELV